jgi:hypothetical protein
MESLIRQRGLAVSKKNTLSALYLAGFPAVPVEKRNFPESQIL